MSACEVQQADTAHTETADSQQPEAVLGPESACILDHTKCFQAAQCHLTAATV